MQKLNGSCQCGNVWITVTGAPNRVGICHCLDCRKHHGAPFYAAAIFPSGAVRVVGETRSFEGRHFCPRCGSSVFAISGEETEVHLGTFDDPNLFVPTYELWTCRRESWLKPVPGAEQFERDRDPETQSREKESC